MQRDFLGGQLFIPVQDPNFLALAPVSFLPSQGQTHYYFRLYISPQTENREEERRRRSLGEHKKEVVSHLKGFLARDFSPTPRTVINEEKWYFGQSLVAVIVRFAAKALTFGAASFFSEPVYNFGSISFFFLPPQRYHYYYNTE